jgi:hypothetical protein
MNEYSPEERAKILDAMQRVEGFKPGSTKIIDSTNKIDHGQGADKKSDARSGQATGHEVTINQNTTVNVTGATDPSATATAVSGAQTQVNQQLARNARSAVVG